MKINCKRKLVLISSKIWFIEIISFTYYHETSLICNVAIYLWNPSFFWRLKMCKTLTNLRNSFLKPQKIFFHYKCRINVNSYYRKQNEIKKKKRKISHKKK